MGCSLSKTVTMADLAVTSQELQSLLASTQLIAKVDAGSTIYALTMIGGVSTFVLSTTKVLKTSFVKGAHIIDDGELLLVKIKGIVRILPGQGTCWYKLLLDLSRKGDENVILLQSGVASALDAARTFSAVEKEVGMPLVYVRGQAVQELNAFARSVGCGFSDGPHQLVMHYSEREGDLVHQCFLGAPAPAAPGTYYTVENQLLDSYEPSANVKSSLFQAESVYQVTRILLEHCKQGGVAYNMSDGYLSLPEGVVLSVDVMENFKKYLLNLSTLAAACQADEIYITDAKRILRYNEGKLTFEPTFSGESRVLILCGGEYSSLVAYGGRNFVKTVALVLEVRIDNPFHQPLLRDIDGTIEEEIGAMLSRFSSVQLLAALMATYAGFIVLFWSSESVGKGYFALLAITFGALLEDEVGLLPDYVSGLVSGSGSFSPWASANSRVLPRNIDKVVTTVLLAFTPAFGGGAYRVVGTLSCALSVLILIGNLGSYNQILRNTPYKKPNNVCVSVALCLEEGISTLVRYPNALFTMVPNRLYTRVVFCYVPVTLLEIVLFIVIFVTMLIALLLPTVLTLIMAVAANFQKIQLPPVGVAWDHRPFVVGEGGLGWDHWDKGIRIPARFVLVAGSPRMKGDVGIFTNSYGGSYQLGGCDYMGDDVVGAFTRIVGGAIKQCVWLAGGTRPAESDLLFAHPAYGCCTSAMHVYGPGLICHEVTLSLVG